MENTKLKRWIWKFCLFVWNICAVIGITVLGYFLYLINDDEGDCLSNKHGVWDSKQKVCRMDCVKWDRERGCVSVENLQDDEQ